MGGLALPKAMALLIATIPLMVLAILIATVPGFVALRYEAAERRQAEQRRLTLVEEAPELELPQAA